MNSFSFFAFLKSLTILLPLTIGLIRFKLMDKAYRPFIFYLLAGFITELASFVLINIYHESNALLSNFFVLSEWLLVVWQFYRWGYFRNHKKSMYLLIVTLVAVWIAENVVFQNLKGFSPYFRVLYSFAIVLMSISIINYTIIHHYENVFRNAGFLICLGFIIFFVYKMVYEWAYQVSSIKQYFTFSRQVISWFGYINAGVNIIFAIAILFFPVRNKFSLK
jgi:hypothetical protein